VREPRIFLQAILIANKLGRQLFRAPDKIPAIGMNGQDRLSRHIPDHVL